MTEVQLLSDHAVDQICDLIFGLGILFFFYKYYRGGRNE